MHIMCCFPAIDKYNLSRYKYLVHCKAANKTVIINHSQNMNTSISHLQYKTSEVIENNIHHHPRTRSLSN